MIDAVFQSHKALSFKCVVPPHIDVNPFALIPNLLPVEFNPFFPDW